jgi:Uncharacterised protein family (UPF0175)/Oxidoreductase molybdopterin binding domain
VLVPVEEALTGGACVARRRNGMPLTRDDSTPLRLMAPEWVCCSRVTWVDRLEMVAEETPTMGETLARTRVPRRVGRTSLHSDDVVQRGMGAGAGCARPASLGSSHPRGQGCPSGDGGSARKGKTMSTITVQIPDDLDLALNVSPDALAPALLVAAAVKLFERGKISAGKAAELAGMPKPLFLVTLAEWGSSASALSAEDIAQDVANA